jgi:predicted DNA-binding antitoxin AbrB/MazE fold protein
MPDMGTQELDAVYEHGTFRPVTPLASPLSEGQRVRLVVEPIAEAHAYLDLATRVFEGLSEDDLAAIETLARRRGLFGTDSPTSA